MQKNINLTLPATLTADMLIETVNNTFSTNIPAAAISQREYLDTFDWRLYKAGFTLTVENGFIYLIDIKSSEAVATARSTEAQPIQGYWSFPLGSLRDRLKKLSDIRALLVQANTKVKKQQIDIINRDRKCTVRLLLEQQYLYNYTESHSVANVLTVIPIRGYAKSAKKFFKFTNKLGLQNEHKNRIATLFCASGHSPCSYSTKIDLDIPKETPANLAAVSLYKTLLEVMKQNEPGIIADLDTEFLHDFRVALRRTRAGLGQLSGIFSDEITQQAKNDMASIGRVTNRLRDLDVYLLKKDYYLKLLPEQLRPNLNHLFGLLQTEREREKQNVIARLNGSEYKNTMQAWSTFLEKFTPGDKSDGPDASTPIIDLARKTIYKTWKKTIKKGRKINEYSPDDDLHNLRLSCKKLRYLLEFFSSLFAKNKMRFLVKQLKALQNKLGDFNDLCVQQETLQDYLDNQVQKKKNAVDVASAIGGLITSLNQKQHAVRLVFAETYSKFDCPGNNQRFRELFKERANHCQNGDTT